MSLYHCLLVPEMIPFPKEVQKFQSIKLDLPFLQGWQGEIEQISRYQYLLTIVKLTGWAAPSLNQMELDVPIKFNPKTTHEISCFFNSPSQKINLLFNFQVQTNDKSAIRLSNSIYSAMINSKQTDIQYLTNVRLADFWTEISAIKLASLDRNSKIWSGYQCKT
ncbi:hypothetical protein [Synechococcus sp. BDU 130192]|uniref:hypothetical protein n=1 Tax=Synechococcus sp. BDU 130192 TaxID=2042059 RepID=UPI000C0807A5|nr:hypothetical protein [Synechococcus sp. BDU 130192]